MMIIRYWQQLSNRYFWSHLLLSMVTAGIVVPTVLLTLNRISINATVFTENKLTTGSNALTSSHDQRPFSFSHLNVIRQLWQYATVTQLIHELKGHILIKERVNNRLSYVYHSHLLPDVYHSDFLFWLFSDPSLTFAWTKATITSLSHTNDITYFLIVIGALRAGPMSNYFRDNKR